MFVMIYYNLSFLLLSPSFSPSLPSSQSYFKLFSTPNSLSVQGEAVVCDEYTVIQSSHYSIVSLATAKTYRWLLYIKLIQCSHDHYQPALLHV